MSAAGARSPVFARERTHVTPRTRSMKGADNQSNALFAVDAGTTVFLWRVARLPKGVPFQRMCTNIPRH